MCTNIIIPSLFPCMLISTIIIKSELIKYVPKKTAFFVLFFISCISGYPTGGSILNECTEKNLISKKTADKLLPCFINAGPAFIINTVGNGVFSNSKTGIIIFTAHIFSSFILFCFSKGFKTEISFGITDNKNSSIIYDSVFNTVNSIKKVCVYIIIFYALNETVLCVFGSKVSSFFVIIGEITSAVFSQNNIYIVTFLLSFCGLSIYMQIFALTTYKISLFNLLFKRIIHGIISVLTLKLLIKIFPLCTPVFSNIASDNSIIFKSANGITYFIMIAFMTICFLMSLKRKSSGNFLKDLI